MSPGGAGGSLPAAFARVVAGMAGIASRHWLTLLAAGAVIFVPLGLLETIDVSVREAVDDREGEGLLDYLEIIGIGAVHTVGAVFGEVLFAGVVTSIVLVDRAEHELSLRELLANLALGRLALADVLLVFVVIAGLLALVLPGILFLVWFALLGPVIEVEHARVRRAFGRSRELVRRRFWLVAGFVIPLSLLDETLTRVAAEASHALFGETFLGEWGAGALAELFTSLPLALAAATLYFELTEGPSAESGRRSSPRTRPRAFRRSRREAPT